MTISRILTKYVSVLLAVTTLTLSGVILSGCATSNKVNQDFKTGADFKSLKTFAWHNFASEIPSSNNNAIKRSVEQALSQKGYQLVTEKPDFVLDMNVITQQRAPSSTGLGLSIGLPLGAHGGLGLGTNKLLSKGDNKDGLIILDITAQASNEVVWRGTADAIPLANFQLRNERQLNAVLNKLVAQFPPQ